MPEWPGASPWRQDWDIKIYTGKTDIWDQTHISSDTDQILITSNKWKRGIVGERGERGSLARTNPWQNNEKRLSNKKNGSGEGWATGASRSWVQEIWFWNHEILFKMPYFICSQYFHLWGGKKNTTSLLVNDVFISVHLSSCPSTSGFICSNQQ